MSRVATRQLLELSPADAARYVLRQDHWSVPERILEALWHPNAKVAVKACHASSKSFTAATAVCLTVLAGGDAITTAPTWAQVKDVLWKEIHRAILTSGWPVSEWGDLNQTELVLPTGERALGLSTNEGVRFQGHHARPGAPLLLVLDEAPGVLPEIYEAVAGIAAGGDVRLLLLGNPVIASGPFYDIFAGAAPGWDRFTIDAFDTPNLQGLTLQDLLALPDHELDAAERPYLVTRRWVRDRYYEWGADHPLWQSRVRGQFPTNADNALIQLAWIEQASKSTEYRDGIPVQAGVDVAGPGEDETVVAVRQGPRILALQAFASPDSRGDVLAFLRPWQHRGLSQVNVDSIGQGYYFAQHLRDYGLPVREVNVGEGSAIVDDHGNAKYSNLKAELYWSLRERFRDGDVTGLVDRVAASQLAGLLYKHDPKGRVVIESKEDARKRGVKSPDRAEAIMLAFAPQQQRDMIGAAFAAQAARPPDQWQQWIERGSSRQQGPVRPWGLR